jgi:hypothetical protein
VTPDEIDAIATLSAKKAVVETFLTLGVNIADPDDVEAAQLDFRHLRAWRESIDTVKRKSLTTAVTVIVTGALGWLLVAFKWPGSSH